MAKSKKKPSNPAAGAVNRISGEIHGILSDTAGAVHDITVHE